MFRLTWPRSVNLMALDSRFLRICSRRWRSVNRVAGTCASAVTSKARPLCPANGSNMPRRPSTRRSTWVLSGRTSSLPASTLAMSRMSLIRLSRSLPAE
ncbi:hypothetical protein D3C79_689560 [compost metagenome]